MVKVNKMQNYSALILTKSSLTRRCYKSNWEEQNKVTGLRFESKRNMSGSTCLFLNNKINSISIGFYPWIPKELVDSAAWSLKNLGDQGMCNAEENKCFPLQKREEEGSRGTRGQSNISIWEDSTTDCKMVDLVITLFSICLQKPAWICQEV